MAENLYICDHRSSNPKWREGWDRTFKLTHFDLEKFLDEHIVIEQKRMQKDLERRIFLGK